MLRNSAMQLRALAIIASLAVLIVACRDAAVPSEPNVDTPAIAQSAEPEYAGRARMLTRMMAVSMQDRAVRTEWKDALRSSPLTEHKLLLRALPATLQGQALISDIARANGRKPEELVELIETLPPMDLYMPIREHRMRWTGDAPDIVVGAVLERKASRMRGFTSTGESSIVDASVSIPAQAVLVLAPATTSGRRISAQASSRGRVVQDVDDGEVSGSVTYSRGHGDSVTVDLAEILQIRRSGVAASLSGAVVLEPKRGAAGTAARARFVAGTAVTGPADTTMLLKFRVKYSDGALQGDDEPFFKTYYLDHDVNIPAADSEVVLNFEEVRFQGITPMVWYAPNVPYIYSRLSDSTQATLFTYLREEDGGVPDIACGSSAVHFGDRVAAAAGYDEPFIVPRGSICWAADTTSDAYIQWKDKPQPSTVQSVSIKPSAWDTHPYFESGCPSYPGQFVQANAPDGAWLDATYVYNHATISSDNPAVALFAKTTTPGFFLNFLTSGSTTVRASVFGTSTSRTVSADPFVNHIAVNPYGPRVPNGHTQQITTTVYDVNNHILTRCGVNSPDFFPLLPTVWTSSNPAVATVTSTGLVTAVGVGTANVTAKIGGYSAISSILAPPNTSFSNTPASPFNQNETVTATLTPAGTYYYDWAYTICNSGSAPGDCNGAYHALTSGISVKTATVRFITSTQYVIFRLNEKLSSTGTVLDSQFFRVDAAGSGGGCTPPAVC